MPLEKKHEGQTIKGGGREQLEKLSEYFRNFKGKRKGG